jgi:hypothetical protein
MTAQDWLPGLDEDEDFEPAPPRRRRSLLVAAAVLAAVVALVAVVVVAGTLTTSRPAPAPAAASSSRSAGPTAAAPERAPVVIRADLSDPAVTGGGYVAPLVIGTQPLQGGVAPDRVPHFDTCQADPATLQYVPVQIRGSEDWVSATFTVEPTASTPPGIGRLGFFFQAGDASTPCPGGAWSTSDSFLAPIADSTITGYVVLDQAFTPSTPQGRADVFGTLQLHVSNIRFSGRLVTVAPPAVGSLCPGTENELCAPLG